MSDFNLNMALVDLAAELVANNLKSALRVQELTKLYLSEQNGKPVSDYYSDLYAQIKSSS